ncbi:MAG: hypothetical protein PHE50_08615 [Dehalococcoidales bacterium]|nr:hypothetical protein [Dehalococcoidales bacterium]
MHVPMKVLDYDTLLRLNASSKKESRSQHIAVENLPARKEKPFIINFHFDHEWQGQKDIRCSVILKPGILTAWLDVSLEEFDAIQVVQMPELDWEAAVCVGIPAWVK